MKKKPSHPMLRKYTVTIEEQIVQEYPPDHGTAQQDRKNNRMERILTITTRER